MTSILRVNALPTSVASEIDALSPRITSTATKPSDHRAIYDHIVNNIIPVLQHDTPCPPLHVITYAIRNILSPSVLYHQVLDLLVLLAHVDQVRCKFLAQADAVLSWDTHFKMPGHNHPDIQVLSDAERRAAEEVQAAQGTPARRVYRQIVLGFSQLALYETWSTPHFTDTLVRELLPSTGNDTSVYLFHRGLSDAEKQELVAARDGWGALLKIYLRNTEMRVRAGLEADDLRAVCLPPFEEKELVALTLQYLTQLEDDVERVNSILNAP